MTLFKKSGKGRMKPFCIKETCSKFLPEDKRGYYKKKTAETEGEAPTEEAPAEEKKTTKKAGAKKSAAKKTTKKATEKKPAAKKSAGKKAKEE